MRNNSILFLLLCLAFLSCNESQEHRKATSKVVKSKKVTNFFLELDDNSHTVKRESDILFWIKARHEGHSWDSAFVYVNDDQREVVYPKIESPFRVSYNLTGVYEIKAVVFYGDSSESVYDEVELISNKKPIEYTFKVVNELPHDPTAFTQGLVYADGIFYEGTGMKGASQLRKVDVKTGNVLLKKELLSSLFGEGITIFNNNLYQLTWKAGLAMVYDKNTFEEISKLNYNGDGWGITNDSTQLIMSNGSNVIKFLRPQDFTVIREIQVYDENGAVGFLNELEYIDGKIYANVWQKDVIIMINPHSGVVEGRINLYKLLPASEGKPGVLNGIAYDHDKNKLYVTGKYWPKVFEIKLKAKTTSS